MSNRCFKFNMFKLNSCSFPPRKLPLQLSHPVHHDPSLRAAQSSLPPLFLLQPHPVCQESLLTTLKMFPESGLLPPPPLLSPRWQSTAPLGRITALQGSRRSCCLHPALPRPSLHRAQEESVYNVSHKMPHCTSKPCMVPCSCRIKGNLLTRPCVDQPPIIFRTFSSSSFQLTLPSLSAAPSAQQTQSCLRAFSSLFSQILSTNPLISFKSLQILPSKAQLDHAVCNNARYLLPLPQPPHPDLPCSALFLPIERTSFGYTILCSHLSFTDGPL